MTLLAGGKAKSCSEVSFAGPAVTDQQNVLPPFDVLSPQQFSNQGLIDRGLSIEIEV
jgi:hypothetical protein